jgi:hypothetical protein
LTPIRNIEKINLAYLNAGEKDFKIGLGLTINPGPAAGNHKLKADISFNLEKITDTFSTSVDEIQKVGKELYIVILKIEHQSFKIGVNFADKHTAHWYQKQLCIALKRLIDRRKEK